LGRPSVDSAVCRVGYSVLPPLSRLAIVWSRLRVFLRANRLDDPGPGASEYTAKKSSRARERFLHAEFPQEDAGACFLDDGIKGSPINFRKTQGWRVEETPGTGAVPRCVFFCTPGLFSLAVVRDSASLQGNWRFGQGEGTECGVLVVHCQVFCPFTSVEESTA